METNGLHLKITADSGSFNAAIDSARAKLVDLGQQTKLLKEGEKDIKQALAEAKKEYGENSQQVNRLTADLADNAKAQEEVKQEVKQVTNELKTAEKAYESYGKATKKGFDDAANSSKSAADSIKSGFTMIKGLIVGYAGKKLYEVLIGSNADYEQSMTSFEVLLGSAEKAENMMSNLDKFGEETPFELPDLTKASTQLLAFGTAEDEVMTKLQQLGDLSRGQSDELGRLTNAYGKMLAKGKVSLEELNMMTEAGVPIVQELTKVYGISQEKLYDALSKGQVGVDGINAAMKNLTSEGGQFFGMMEKQSQTMEGMFSTFSDSAANFARNIGEESFNYLKSELDNMLEVIQEMKASGELQELAQDIGETIGAAVKNFIEFAKWLYETKDIILAGAGAFVTYKTSLTILMSAQAAFNTVKELFNIITGKTVVCKNLETGATLKLTAAEAAEVTAKNGAIAAQSKFNAVCNANPYVVIISLVLAMAGAVVAYTKAAGDAAETTDSLTKSYNENIDAIDKSTAAETASAEKVKVLKDRLYELDDQLQSNTLDTYEAAAAKEEMKGIVEQLNKTIPDMRLNIDSETGAWNKQRSEIDLLTDSYYKLTYAKAMAVAYDSKINEAAKTIADAKEKLKTTPATKSVIIPGALSFPGGFNTGLFGIDDPFSEPAWGGLATKYTIPNQERIELYGIIRQAENNIKTWTAEMEEQLQIVDDLTPVVGTKETERETATLGPGTTRGTNTTKDKTCSYCKQTGHTASECPVKKKDEDEKKAAEEAEKDRQKGVKSYIDGIKETEQDDLDFESRRRTLGWMSDDELLFAKKERSRRWAEYLGKLTGDIAAEGDEAAVIESMTPEERLEYIKEFQAEADDAWVDWYVQNQENIKTEKERLKDEFKDGIADSEKYIEDMNHYGLWEKYGDSEAEAIKRVIAKTEKAFKEGKITYEEYLDYLDDWNKRLYDLENQRMAELLEQETEKRHAAYEEKFNKTKTLWEKRYNAAKEYWDNQRELVKESTDAEIAAIDALIAKRKEEQEDDDDNLKLQRLINKRDYENDEDNRKNIQKQIDELAEDIEEKKFKREMQNRKDAAMQEKEYKLKKIDEEEEYETKSYNRRLEALTKSYERKMSEVNIAKEIAESLDIKQLETLGDTIGSTIGGAVGSAMESSIRGALRSIMNYFNEKTPRPADGGKGTFSDSIVNNKYYNVAMNVLGTAGRNMSVHEVTGRLSAELELGGF